MINNKDTNQKEQDDIKTGRNKDDRRQHSITREREATKERSRHKRLSQNQS